MEEEKNLTGQEETEENRTPNKKRLKRERQAYEEAEREDREHGNNSSSDNTGECKDIL